MLQWKSYHTSGQGASFTHNNARPYTNYSLQLINSSTVFRVAEAAQIWWCRFVGILSFHTRLQTTGKRSILQCVSNSTWSESSCQGKRVSTKNIYIYIWIKMYTWNSSLTLDLSTFIQIKDKLLYFPLCSVLKTFMLMSGPTWFVLLILFPFVSVDVFSCGTISCPLESWT